MNTTTCEPIENFLDVQCDLHGDTTAFIFFFLEEAGLVKTAHGGVFDFTELGYEYFKEQWDREDFATDAHLGARASMLREAAMALLSEADRLEREANSSRIAA